MNNNQITQACYLCESIFNYGQGRYEGKFIPTYGFTICEICYDGNHDGYAPHLEDKIRKALEKNKLPAPQRNSKGLFPRE